MAIEAYCDASTSSGTSVAVSVILDDYNFIDLTVGIFDNVDTGSEGELLGVIQTLNLLNKNKLDKDVTVYVDNKPVAIKSTEILNTGFVPYTIAHRKTYKKLLKFKKRGIKIAHILGHQSDHNCNKLCDMLSHSILERVI